MTDRTGFEEMSPNLARVARPRRLPSAKEATIFKECQVRMHRWEPVMSQASAVSGRGEENKRAESIADSDKCGMVYIKP